MKPRFILSLILLGVLHSSCTSLMYTKIDVLRPAKVTFAPNATDLLILNNSVVQPASVGHKNVLLGERTKNITVNTDSLAVFCLSVVNEEFNKYDFFNSTQLHLPSVNTSGSYLTTTLPKPDSLQTLSATYGANVFLSLDKLRVFDKIEEFYNEQTGSFYAVFEVNYETSWSVNYPNQLKPVQINLKDTVYWDYETYQRKKLLSGLPNRYNALIDGALYVGQNAMKKFVPWWDKEDRYFFMGENKYLFEGMDSVKVKNWDSAIKIWKKGLTKSNKAMQAKLLNNIAIAYEILGDMDSAKNSILKAIEVYEQNSVMNYNNYFRLVDYKTHLLNRIKEVELINIQLGVKK